MVSRNVLNLEIHEVFVGKLSFGDIEINILGPARPALVMKLYEKFPTGENRVFSAQH